MPPAAEDLDDTVTQIPEARVASSHHENLTVGQLIRAPIVGAVTERDDKYLVATTDEGFTARHVVVATGPFLRDVTLAFSRTGRSNADAYAWRYWATSSFGGYVSLGDGKAIPGRLLYCAGVNSLRESHRDRHAWPISGPASRITKRRLRPAR